MDPRAQATVPARRLEQVPPALVWPAWLLERALVWPAPQQHDWARWARAGQPG
jgi:hypothetical protein